MGGSETTTPELRRSGSRRRDCDVGAETAPRNRTGRLSRNRGQATDGDTTRPGASCRRLTGFWFDALGRLAAGILFRCPIRGIRYVERLRVHRGYRVEERWRSTASAVASAVATTAAAPAFALAMFRSPPTHCGQVRVLRAAVGLPRVVGVECHFALVKGAGSRKLHAGEGNVIGLTCQADFSA